VDGFVCVNEAQEHEEGGKKTLSSHLSLSLDKFLSLLKIWI